MFSTADPLQSSWTTGKSYPLCKDWLKKNTPESSCGGKAAKLCTSKYTVYTENFTSACLKFQDSYLLLLTVPLSNRWKWELGTPEQSFYLSELYVCRCNDIISHCNQVYISCQVMMCVAGDPNTRCSQGCQNSVTGRGKREAVSQGSVHFIFQGQKLVSGRGKREALSQGSMHFISQGPLRLRRSAESTQVSGTTAEIVFSTPACLLDYLRSNSNFTSLFSSNEHQPESEPCLHCRMPSCGCCHDRCSGRVQSQNVQDQISALGHKWRIDSMNKILFYFNYK